MQGSAATSVVDQVIDELNDAQFELGEFIVAAAVLVVGVVLGRPAGWLAGWLAGTSVDGSGTTDPYRT